MEKVVGVLGGGQLGRMLAEAANRLNVKLVVLDKENAPAKQILGATTHVNGAKLSHITGSFKDPAAITELAKVCDVVTAEIEHIDTNILEELASQSAITFEPSWKTVATIQDKYEQKLHLKQAGVPTADAMRLDTGSVEELQRVAECLSYPFMLKSRREAYDGRGNFPVKSSDDLLKGADFCKGRGVYAERWAQFKAELAVMVVKRKDSTLAFPTVETVHENSICKLVYAPARNVSGSVSSAAQALARKAVGAFEGKGVFGVEMFLLRDDSLLINEIAPRPHNSGHYTIEACPLSQYDAHLRAILDLPIPEGSLRMREPAVMLNILGGRASDPSIQTLVDAALANPRTSVHLYAKGAPSPGRKMGHVTVTASTMTEAESLTQPLIDVFDKMMGSESSAVTTPASTLQLGPQVAVIMGSDSDLPTLTAGLKILDQFSIPYTVRITSAHRTPEVMASFVSSAASLGIKVIIAAAGGAAHLPGMSAAYTSLPVIGVPIKGSSLDGVDSLHSIVQMPRGVPVATVAINNSVNAALLAARILGVADLRVRKLVEDYAKAANEEVREKDRLLRSGDWEGYLERKK